MKNGMVEPIQIVTNAHCRLNKSEHDSYHSSSLAMKWMLGMYHILYSLTENGGFGSIVCTSDSNRLIRAPKGG